MMLENQNGFTLIELLVVLAIVAIITATAIPAYQHYRAQAYDFRALSDLRVVALAEESYFLEEENYLACSGGGCAGLPGLSRLSEGVELDVETSEDPKGFQITSYHQDGTGKSYSWDSNQGGLQP